MHICYEISYKILKNYLNSTGSNKWFCEKGDNAGFGGDIAKNETLLLCHADDIAKEFHYEVF